jgi:hypothetical protein
MENRVSISDEEMFFLLGTQNISGAHASSYEAVKQGSLLGCFVTRHIHFHLTMIFNPLLFTSNRFTS